MKKAAITKEIKSHLKAFSTKNPGLFDLPKAMELKEAFENTTSIDQVINLIDDHVPFLIMAFGVTEESIEILKQKLGSM
jgi:hypothetical protein